jgi:hypothetical protein
MKSRVGRLPDPLTFLGRVDVAHDLGDYVKATYASLQPLSRHFFAERSQGGRWRETSTLLMPPPAPDPFTLLFCAIRVEARCR